MDQNASAEDRDTVAQVAAIDPNRQVGAGPLDVYGLTTTKSRCENGLVCGYWRLKWSLLVPNVRTCTRDNNSLGVLQSILSPYCHLVLLPSSSSPLAPRFLYYSYALTPYHGSDSSE